MKTGSKIYLIITLLAVILMLMVVIFKKKPPLGSISEARIKLLEAERQHASIYSEELFRKASLYYDSAMLQWNKENDKFFLSRNFGQIKKYAEQSKVYALKATASSNKNVNEIKGELVHRIQKVQEQINNYKQQFKNFQINRANSQELTRCQLYLKEGNYAFKQQNFLLAEYKIDTAEIIVENLEKKNRQILEEYFKDYLKWNQMVETAIEESKKSKTYCIVINKYERECLVFRNGTLTDTFKIELGINWMGDKNYQGDRSTPEGEYKIVKRKTTGETKYYKAFLLDYPNEDDKKRFISNKKNGIIGQDATIGNLIEIHGEGGKGIDWTDGCIALINNDMDKLFKICDIGTNVTIVGSIKPLNEILKIK